MRPQHRRALILLAGSPCCLCGRSSAQLQVTLMAGNVCTPVCAQRIAGFQNSFYPNSTSPLLPYRSHQLSCSNILNLICWPLGSCSLHDEQDLVACKAHGGKKKQHAAGSNLAACVPRTLLGAGSLEGAREIWQEISMAQGTAHQPAHAGASDLCLCGHQSGQGPEDCSRPGIHGWLH